MSSVWIPFTSGNLAKVCISYTRQLESDKPINIHMTGAGQHAFQEVAQRAAYAVYDWAKNCSRPLDPHYIGLDLEGLQKGDALSGESGGVAFAVALAQELLQENTDTVVATGQLLPKGNIGTIDGLDDKISAAKEISCVGWFLYPQKNLLESDCRLELEKLLQELKESGWRVHAVSTIAEVLSLLFCPKNESADKVTVNNRKSFLPILVVGLLLFSVVVAGVMFSSSDDEDKSEQLNHGSIDALKSQNDKKTAAASRPSIAVAEINQKPQLKLQGEFRGITGDGKVGIKLAHLVSSFVNQQVDIEWLEPLPQIKILGVTEEMTQHGNLTSLSIQMTESHVNYLKTKHSIPSFELSVSEQGVVDQALEGISEQISRHFIGLIPQKSHPEISGKIKAELKKSGFE